jgi:hypothetical protein
MPGQQRVRRRNRGNGSQGCTPDAVRPHGQSSAIVIGQAQPAGPQLAPQKSVFFDQVRDRFTLSGGRTSRRARWP